MIKKLIFSLVSNRKIKNQTNENLHSFQRERKIYIRGPDKGKHDLLAVAKSIVYCMNNPLRYVDPSGMMGDIPRMSLDEWLGPSDRSASDLLNEMRASQDYFSGLAEEAYHDIMFGSDNYQDYDNNVVLPGSPKHVYENKLDIAGISINYIQSPNDGRNVTDLTVRVPISLSSFDIAEIITGVAFPYSFLMPNVSGHETSFNTLEQYDSAIMNRPSITSPIMPITITDIRTEVTVMCVTSDTRLKEGSVSLFTIFGVQTSGEIFRYRIPGRGE